MKLQEIFDQLQYGEFSQLSIGGQAAGVINENNWGNVLGHINLGLTSLYKRFNLKERRLTFPLQSCADVYQLQVADILKLEKVVTDSGGEVNLNRDGDPYSCFTPTLRSLRVPQVILDQGSDLPDWLKTTSLTVVYRANHPKLTMKFGILFPETLEIELPSSHLEALLYFVASRVQNPIGMTQEGAVSMQYFARYEQACQELEGKGLQVDRDSDNTRLQRAGWV